jgi:RimJ/RimL family protein N-acetyltransferase
VIIDPLDKNMTGEQMKKFTYYLLNGAYACPDAIRDYTPLVKVIKRLFNEKDNVFMAITTDHGLSGVYGIINVVKGHNAQFISWFWDKEAITPGVVHNIRNFLTYCKDVYSLKRVTAETSCDKHERILGLVGFKIEGRFRHGFKWHGEFRNLIRMRIIGEC